MRHHKTRWDSTRRDEIAQDNMRQHNTRGYSTRQRDTAQHKGRQNNTRWDSTRQDETAQHKVKQHKIRWDGTRQDETAQDKGIQHKTKGYSTAQGETARHKVRQHKTRWDSTTQGETAQDKMRRHKTRWDSTRQDETAQDKMRQHNTGSNDLSLHKVELSGNCLHLQMPENRDQHLSWQSAVHFNGFSTSGQFDAAELIRYMITKPQRRQPDQTHLMLQQMSGDVHPDPGPATKYPCPVCTRNVTSRRVSYKYTKCYGWVHAKYSGILNAAQYRRKSDWTWEACLAPQSQQSPPTTTTKQISDDSTFNVLQLNDSGIGNKLTELEVVLERNKVKVAVIQESKLSPKSKNLCIQNYNTVRKDRSYGQGGGLLIFIHRSITFSKQPSSPESLSIPTWKNFQ